MFLDDMKATIEGISGVTETVFPAHEPEGSDTAIMVYETGGGEPWRASDSSPGGGLERPRLQVQVRNISYATARTQLAKVIQGLDHWSGTVNSTKYHYCRLTTNARSLKRDKSPTSTLVIRHYVYAEFELIKDFS